MNKDQLKAKLAKLTPEQRQALLAKRQNKQGQAKSALTTTPAPATPAAKAVQTPPELTASLAVSNAQTRMWMFEKFTGSGSAYNIVSALHLQATTSATSTATSDVDLAGIAWAFNQVIARHEILRSGFIEQHGQLKTDIQPQLTIELQRVDATAWTMQQHEQEITARIMAWAAEPINLRQTPLVQLRALCLQDGSVVLVMLMHHIIADGWSLRLLEQELSHFYAKWQAGERDVASALPVQYKHYVGWESEWLASKQAKAQLLYWKKHLANAPELLPLPELTCVEGEVTQTADSYIQLIPKTLSQRVDQVAPTRQLSPFMMYIAAFKLSLAHYTGVEDVVVGTPVANRRKAWVSELIGLLSNSVALRSQPLQHITLADYLQQVRKTTLGAFDHQELPFEKVVEAVNPERHQELPPLFQVLFALQSTEDSDLHLGDLAIAALKLPRHAAEFPITAEMFLTSGNADSDAGFLNWTYQHARFNAEQIQQLSRVFLHCVELMLDAPHLSIAEVYARLAAPKQTVPQQALADAITAHVAGVATPDNATPTLELWLDASLPAAVLAQLQRLPLPTSVVMCVDDVSHANAQVRCCSSVIPKNANAAQWIQINPSQAELNRDSVQLWLLESMAILRDSQNQLHLCLLAAETTDDSLPTGAAIYNAQQQPLAAQLVGELILDNVVMSSFTSESEQGTLAETAHSAEHPTATKVNDVAPPQKPCLHASLATGIRAIRRGEQLVFDGINSNIHQVWFAGQRVDLAQLNAQLHQLPTSDEVVCLVRSTRAASSVLVAYVVPTGAFNLQGWREAAQVVLAKFGLSLHPFTVVVVSQLPRNAQGELQLDKLTALPAISDDEIAQLAAQDEGWYWEATQRQTPQLILNTTTPQALNTTALQTSNTASGHGADVEPSADDIALSNTPSVLTTAPLALTETSAIDLLRVAAQHQAPKGITSIGSTGESTQALIAQARFLSYAELYAQAMRIAAGLQAQGIQAGDIVALQLYEVQDILLGFWGATLAGAVVLDVEMPADYTDPEDKDVARLQHALDSLPVRFAILPSALPTGAETLFTARHVSFATLDTLQTSTDAYRAVTRCLDDTLLLLLTSGSTGKPKVVTQTHGAVCLYAHSFPITMNLTTDSVCFNWMPLQHVGGIVMCHATLIALNAHQIHCPTATILNDPLRLLGMFSHYRATMCWSPNFAFALINEAIQENERDPRWKLSEQGWDLSCMHILLNGGEAVVHSTVLRFVEQLMSIGLPAHSVHPIWGMSETCSGTLVNVDFDPFVETDNNYVDLGGPIRGLDFRVVDGNDMPQREGRSGRLQARGALITRGYYNNDEANQSAFTKDGWFTTGDLAVLRNGNLAIVGREKDLIIINGLNYHGLDIEQCVESLPTIMKAHTAACAVRRESDDTDKLCVFYAAEEGVAANHERRCEEIRQITGKQLGVVPSYMVPLAPDDFPRTSIGKIQRSELAQRFMQGEFDQAAHAEHGTTASAQQLPAFFHRPVWKPAQSLQQTAADRQASVQLLVLPTQQAAAQATGLPFVVIDSEQTQPLRFDDSANAIIDLRFWQLTDSATASTQDSATTSSQDRAMTSAMPSEMNSTAALHSTLTRLWKTAPQIECASDALRACHQLSTLPHLVVCANALSWQHDGKQPDIQDCTATSLIGALAALRSEFPALISRWVGMQSDNAFPSADELKLLLAELRQHSARPVFLEPNQRWQQVLQPCFRNNRRVHLPAPDTENAGVQVVIGGFGGIGRALTQQLLQQGYSVAVIGRRDQASISADIEADAALKTVLTAHATHWQYVQADVVNVAVLHAAFVQVSESRGRPIERVFYLAGASRPALVAEQTAQDIHSVLAAKSYGIEALQTALSAWPDAEQIHFSSSTALLGGKTFHAYSAANAYQQMRCEQLAQQGKAVRCLLWSMWQQLGMSEGAQDAAVRAAGYHLLTAEQGLQAMQIAFTLPTSYRSVLIGIDDTALAMQPLAIREAELLYAPKLSETTDLTALPQQDSFGQRIHYLQAANDALPRDDLSRDTAYQTLKAVWESVLQHTDLTPEANFFALGGDSILAIQAVARAAEQGVFIQPRDLFEQQTLLRLRQVVADQQQLGEQETITGEVALMPMQRWFFEAELTAADHMNQSVLLSCQHPLDTDVLQRALNELVTYHDGLRAHFVPSTTAPSTTARALPQQVYRDAIDVPLEVVTVADDLTHAEFNALVFNTCDAAQANLAIQHGPLLRAVYLHANRSDACRLFLAVHHLVVDGVSWRVLVESLIKLYSALVDKPEHDAAAILGPKSHSIRQWVDSIERYLATSHAEIEANHWRLALAQGQGKPSGLPPELGGDNQRVHETQVELHFTAEQTDILFNQLPFQHDIKADDILLTALAMAFEQCTGQRDFSVLMEGHGRELPEGFDGLDLTRTIGWFTAMYPVYLSHLPDGNTDVQLSTAQRVLATHRTLQAVPHGGVTLQWLRYLGNARQQQAVAGDLPGISYNYLGKFDGGDSALFGFAMEATGKQIADAQQRLNDIDVLGRILDDKAAFSFIYSAARYSATQMQAFAEAFQHSLHVIAALPDASWQQAKAQQPVVLGDGISADTFHELATSTLAQHALTPARFTQRYSHILPTTPLQLGLIFETLLSTGGTYVSQLINEISGSLNVEALRAAWQDVINTHSVYRTGFVATQAGQYLQLIEREATIPFMVDDWRNQSEAQQEAAFEQLLQSDRAQGFDFEAPPLLRITLIQMADQRHRMLMSEHHAVCDGWSRSVILALVAQRYRHYCQAWATHQTEIAAIPAQPQYADYVHWLQRFDRHSAEAYWQGLPLANAKIERLAGQKPFDGLSNHSAKLTFDIDATISEQAQQAAREASVTLNAVAQAAWALCLRLYSQSDLLVFATTHSGRPTQLAGVEQIVGPLINTLPVVAEIDAQQTVQAFLQQMQHQLMQITEHGYLSVADIGELHQRSDLSDLQQSLFVFENFPLTAPEASDADDLHINWVKSMDSTEYPITLSVVPDGALKIFAYYLCDYFDVAQVEQICRHYQQILSALSQQLTHKIADIEWVSSEDEQLIKQQHHQLHTQLAAQVNASNGLAPSGAPTTEPSADATNSDTDDDLEMFEF